MTQDLKLTPLIAFAEEAARYFEGRDTKGEDSAHWSNVTNAENCRKIAITLAAFAAQPASDDALAKMDGTTKIALGHFQTTTERAQQITKLEAERDALREALKRKSTTGCFDRDGNELFVGDRVRYNLAGPHTKEEYWNPEYEIIFEAPCFTLKHIGGGKDGGNHLFALKHGGGNGYLERLATKEPSHE